MVLRLRLLGWLVLLGVAAWWARLLAHSKKPAPEGEWRELDPAQLRPRG